MATSESFLDYTSEVINGDAFTGGLTDIFSYTSPSRNTLNVYLTIYKIDLAGAVDYQITPSTYTPSSASTFTFDELKDGYYRFKYAVIPTYDDSTDYDQWDVVSQDDVVYQAVVNPPMGTEPPNASYWTAVSDPTTMLDLVGTSSEPGNLLYQLYERIIYPFSKTGFGDASETAALENDTGELADAVKNYEMMAVLVKGMTSCDVRGKFLRGERICRRGQELISTF